MRKKAFKKFVVKGIKAEFKCGKILIRMMSVQDAHKFYDQGKNLKRNNTLFKDHRLNICRFAEITDLSRYGVHIFHENLGAQKLSAMAVSIFKR